MAAATFPGVVVHEIAHRFFADVTGTPVYKVCYFQLGDPSGYVVHGPIKRLRDAFLISVGPLILNTVLCALITFVAVPVLLLEPDDFSLIFLPLLWVGFSIGMHAFPSNQDMNNFVEAVHQARGSGLLRVVVGFFARLFQFANALRAFWFDLFYAVGVSLLLPLVCGLL